MADDLTLIEFFHTRRGALWTGSLTACGGRAEASWSVEQGGRTALREGAVPLAEADRLWRGVAAAVTAGGAFRRWLVTDPTAPLDAERNRMLTLVRTTPGRNLLLTLLVPVGNDDPAFSTWLRGFQTLRGLPPAPPGTSRRGDGGLASRGPERL